MDAIVDQQRRGMWRLKGGRAARVLAEIILTFRFEKVLFRSRLELTSIHTEINSNSLKTENN